MPSHRIRGRRAKVLTNDAGIPIDRKTKQLVFYECDVETVKRVTLKPGENFSREGANHVFERGYRKRQARATLFCLTDRMRLQKRNTIGLNPFRKVLTYREIKHFFVFPSSPNVFMLCVVDEMSGKKLYEMFRCRPEDVNTICDLTFKASTDEQNLLRDYPAIRQLSISSRDFGTEPSGLDYISSREPSLEEIKEQDHMFSSLDYDKHSTVNKVDRVLQNSRDAQNSPLFDSEQIHTRERQVSTQTTDILRPIANESKIKGVYSCYDLVEPNRSLYNGIDRTESDSDISDFPTRSQPKSTMNGTGMKPRIQQSNLVRSIPTPFESSKNSPSGYRSVQPRLTRYSPVEQAKKKIRIVIERDPEMSAPVRKSISTQNLNWGDKVTYVSYNPIDGTNISDCGPMYMYITRYESTRDLTDLSPNYRFDSSNYR